MHQQDRLAPWEVQISTATCSFNSSQVAQADEQAPHHRKRNTSQKEGRQQVILGWLSGQLLRKSGHTTTPWLTAGLYVHHVAFSMLGNGRKGSHLHL